MCLLCVGPMVPHLMFHCFCKVTDQEVGYSPLLKISLAEKELQTPRPPLTIKIHKVDFDDFSHSTVTKCLFCKILNFPIPAYHKKGNK